MAQAVCLWEFTVETGFDFMSVHVGFVVDKVTQGQVFFLAVFPSTLLIIIPKTLHTHSFIYHR
jgi:hypothetical protein